MKAGRISEERQDLHDSPTKVYVQVAAAALVLWLQVWGYHNCLTLNLHTSPLLHIYSRRSWFHGCDHRSTRRRINSTALTARCKWDQNWTTRWYFSWEPKRTLVRPSNVLFKKKKRPSKVWIWVSHLGNSTEYNHMYSWSAWWLTLIQRSPIRCWKKDLDSKTNSRNILSSKWSSIVKPFSLRNSCDVCWQNFISKRWW